MKASVGMGAATGLALAGLIPVAQASVQRPAQTAHHQGPAAPVHAHLTAYLSTTVTVQPGQTLGGIAAALGVSLSALEASNPQLANPNLIFPGQKISLSGSAPAAPARTAQPAAAVGTAQPVGGAAAAAGSFAGCVIQRESGGNAQAVNPAGYWGLYQFSRSTWEAYGGSAATYGSASAAEQTRVFNNAVAQGGSGNWSAYDGC